MASDVTTKARRRHPSRRPRPRKRAGSPSGAENHLYLQIARTLKDEIVNGTHPVGSRLPPEDDLSVRFGVSRHTVREALRRLREDNLVASRQGSGTVVVSIPSNDAYAHDIMSINDLVSWSASKRFEIQSMEMTTLTRELATRSGLARGEPWLVVRGLGREEGLEVPACWAEYYIHSDFAAVGRLLPRHTGPIFPLLEDLFGVKVVDVHQTIGATLIEPRLSRLLDAQPASAALEVKRTYQLFGGQVAQVTVSTHPAARYRHSTTLRRMKS